MRKLSLPLIHEGLRKRVLVWGALIFALVYVGLGACPWKSPSPLPLTFLDRAIPLLPWTLLIYLSDYIFILLILVSLKKSEDFSSAFYSMILGIVMSFAVFLVYPTVYPRPELPLDPFWSDTFLYLHFLDQPTNCFPSLHVSMTVIAAASMPPWPKRFRIMGWIWAAAICLSTLSTKQHYGWDVLGGLLVALASLRVTARLRW